MLVTNSLIHLIRRIEGPFGGIVLFNPFKVRQNDVRTFAVP